MKKKRSQRKEIARAPRQKSVGDVDKSWRKQRADERQKEKKEMRIEKITLKGSWNGEQERRRRATYIT